MKKKNPKTSSRSIVNIPLNRRAFLTACLSLALLPACKNRKYSTNMIESIDSKLPFQLFRAPGDFVIEAWTDLTNQFKSTGSVVVLGPEEELEYLGNEFVRDSHGTPTKILESAKTLDFPPDFRAHLREQLADQLEWMKQNNIDFDSMYIGDFNEPNLTEDQLNSEWPPTPVSADNSPGLSIALSWETGKPYEHVLLAVVPTQDWTEIPAYMPFGGWNSCPNPEWHIAAFRYWRDKWGAKLVGISHDTLNMRVERKPSTRREAFSLASEQYHYCSDIVHQGVGDVFKLAHSLMGNDWWYFWWD